MTEVSEEHPFHLRPMTENSLVFLMSKDKVLQSHFPQEERAHLFKNGIKNIWIFEHITVLSPFTCSWNPRNTKFMLTAGSFLTALPQLLPEIPQGRLFQTDYKQEGREFIWTRFLTILSGSGCQQGKNHWQQKKAFQCGSVVKSLPANVRSGDVGLIPDRR